MSGSTQKTHLMTVYRGRFAPTPSGNLHLGSLFVALASWLAARSAGGSWWVRIDDLDHHRMEPGAPQAIVETLEHFGLTTETPTCYQSKRVNDYQDLLHTLSARGIAYPCGYSRKEVKAMGGIVQPSTRRPVSASTETAWRAALPDNPLGDPIIWRRDGIPGYLLATLHDDLYDQCSDIVRGSDLKEVSDAQEYLLEALGEKPPRFWHLPLINKGNEKLAKRHQATDVRTFSTEKVLLQCLQWLGLETNETLAQLPAKELLEAALEHWPVGQPSFAPFANESFQADSFT